MTRTRRGMAGLILVATIQASCGKVSDGEHQVRAHAFRQGSELFLVFENVSRKRICMPPIAFSDAERSGVHLYLYDPRSRELQQSFALVTWVPGAKKDCAMVMPGESRAGTYRIKFVMNYFSRPPECFYLVAVYGWASPAGMVTSGPSKPLRVCKADYAGDPSPY